LFVFIFNIVTGFLRKQLMAKMLPLEIPHAWNQSCFFVCVHTCAHTENDTSHFTLLLFALGCVGLTPTLISKSVSQ